MILIFVNLLFFINLSNCIWLGINHEQDGLIIETYDKYKHLGIEDQRMHMRNFIFNSYTKGLYFILVTLSSVGYGDSVSMPDNPYFNFENDV